MRERVLIISGKVDVRGALARRFQAQNFGVELAGTTGRALRLLTSQSVIIAYLDEQMSSCSKEEFRKACEEASIPVFTLPASLSPSDSAALDDLVAQASRSRRNQGHDVSDHILRFENFRFDPARFLLLGNGEKIQLTRQEFDLLALLLRSSGRTCSRPAILSVLARGGSEPTDRAVDMIVMRLRRKLGDDPRRPALIAAVPGEGYRFLATVTSDVNGQDSRAGDQEEDVAVPVLPGRPVRLSALKSKATKLGVGALALSALAGGALLWRDVGKIRPPGIALATPVLAVLPFEAMSGGSEGEALANGISEDVITGLATFPNIAVVARNSTAALKGKPQDMRQLRERLRADYAIEGSVRRDDGRVRIVAQLIDLRTGNHVWASRYDNAATDVPGLRDEIVARIVNSIADDGGAVRQAEYRKSWGRDSSELGEYDYYVRGHAYFNGWTRREDLEKAGEIWREGLARYPDSAMLRAKLGWYHFNHAWNGGVDDPGPDMTMAHRYAEEVLRRREASPQPRRLAQWLMARVAFIEERYVEARVAMSEAVAMAPGDGEMKADLAEVATAVGRPDIAVAWLQDRLAMGQEQSWILFYLSMAYNVLGDYKRSLDFANRMDPPEHKVFQHKSKPLLRAMALVQLGQVPQARAEISGLLARFPALSQSAYRRDWPLEDKAVLERQVTDLAQAGLPP
jgi:TolB-like protein/DNA-binding response OmpR family regulator